jgi:hypothetical protein
VLRGKRARRELEDDGAVAGGSSWGAEVRLCPVRTGMAIPQPSGFLATGCGVRLCFWPGVHDLFTDGTK